MKRYKVTAAFSLLEKVLMIEDDVVYAEVTLQMMSCYSPKTRKFLGKVSIEKFNKHTKEDKSK